MAALLWLALAAVQAPAEEAPYALENGLTVLLKPAAAGERVALVVLYSVGAHQDPKGKSGLAHLVEHLYVTAPAGETRARTATEFFQKYGGQANAQTGERYTVFAAVFDPGRLGEELADAAARMGGPAFDADLLERERGRLLEEVRNMFGGIPPLGAVNRAAELLRPTPNGGRKGGLPEDVKTITAEEARRFWKRMYAPRRAVLVVAGTFDPRAAREMIAKSFAAIPAGDPIPAPADPAPGKPGGVEDVEVRAVTEGAKAQVALGFAAPAPDSELYPGYLACILRLAKRGPKVGPGAGFDAVRFAPLDDPSFAGIVAPLQGEESTKDAVARLDSFVAETLKAPLDEAERRAVIHDFGPALGMTPVPDLLVRVNPYLVAFSAGRRLQMGFDSPKLKAAIDGLKNEDLGTVQARVFSPAVRSAVVLRIRK